MVLPFQGVDGDKKQGLAVVHRITVKKGQEKNKNKTIKYIGWSKVSISLEKRVGFFKRQRRHSV